MLKRIGYSTIRFRSLIAKGSYGEVWRGELEGTHIAIKRLLHDMRSNVRVIEAFANEIRLSSSLDHPSIERYVDFSWRSLSEISMVSEFMTAGNILNLLHAQEDRNLTWRKDKLPLVVSVVTGLVYLHSFAPVIIHQDLKSSNVLLSENFTAKLSDFGLSREWSLNQIMTNGVGTLLWSAPEVIRGDRFTEKTGIYSFGIVLSELDTCMKPFAPRQLNSMEALALIRSG